MQFGAKRCAQWARRGCTWHDGQAKLAWAARTGLPGAPHSVRRSRVPTSKIKLQSLKKVTKNEKCFKKFHAITL
jgi:hypothetical protein